MTDFDSFMQMRGQKGRKAFAMASFICGLISLLTICTGLLPIPFGALSILFALLFSRENEKTNPLTICGIALSVLGIVAGVILTAYVFYMLKYNPEFYEYMNRMSMQLYGMPLPY